MWIDAGSRAETDETNGTAHFLEHLAFKVLDNLRHGPRSPLGNSPSRRMADHTHSLDRALRSGRNSNWSSRLKTWALTSTPTPRFVRLTIRASSRRANLENSARTQFTSPRPSMRTSPGVSTSCKTFFRTRSSRRRLSSGNATSFSVRPRRLRSSSRRSFSTTCTPRPTRTSPWVAPSWGPARTSATSPGPSW